MKKTLSIVAIGLNFMLSRIDSTNHYDLNDTNLVKRNLEKINQNLPYGGDTECILLQADIESMYDNIEPLMVLESLHWLFQEIKKVKRGDRLAINFQTKSARFGRNYGDWYEIKYEEILNIIEYMLNNSYVRIGVQYIAKQIKGLPQGAPPSPPLARLVCIKKEWEYNILINERRLIWGLRFMDDLLLFFFYNSKDLKSKISAENRKNDFRENCYFKQWKLKNVDNQIFLSTEILLRKGKINFRWANKNRESIRNEKKQKIIRYIHANSNTATIIKNNSIYSQFLRVARNSDEQHVMDDFNDLFEEYKLLGYREALINFQMKKVVNKFGMRKEK